MLIGNRLNGRYKIVRMIGGGGMASVYLARDIILDRDVAIKVLRLDFAGEEEFIRRFQREAQAASSLVHPNIVSIYDIGEEEHIHFIVMEYVDGMTLKEFIQTHSPLSYKKVVSIMKQITAAVAFAHQHSIIHRDIKPDNMLIDQNGVVKITDFGIAMATSATSITQTNTVLGSIHYISPEQARGGMATKKTDMYALGIVMYELLTGELPFKGETAVSVALKHLQSDTPSIKEKDSAMPQSLENIVLHAMAKDPLHRYASAEEMEEDLLTALETYRINEPKFNLPNEEMEETKVIPIVQKTVLTKPVQPVPALEEKPADAPKKKRKRWPWLFLAVLLIGLATAAIWPVATAPKSVMVPDTAGSSPEAAAAKLINEGFVVGDSRQEFSPAVDTGKVIRTNPAAGVTATEGDEVNLVVSAGKQQISMEDYTNKTVEETRELLEEAGFRDVHVELVHNIQATGTVLEQSPNAGKQVIPEETEVELSVSKGQANIILKDLTGYTEKSLNDYADSNGLMLDIKKEFSNDVPAEQVIRQHPANGTEIAPGSTVYIALSKGPEKMPTATVSVKVIIPYEPEVEGQPQEVQLYVQDLNMSMTEPYEKFVITEETTKQLEFTIEKGTKAGYKVVRDQLVIIENEVPFPGTTISHSE